MVTFLLVYIPDEKATVKAQTDYHTEDVTAQTRAQLETLAQQKCPPGMKLARISDGSTFVYNDGVWFEDDLTAIFPQ